MSDEPKDPPIKSMKDAEEKFNLAIKDIFNTPQSDREKAGFVPEMKVTMDSIGWCEWCRGSGRVIVAMACMPPHIYGDCGRCGGKGRVEPVVEPVVEPTMVILTLSKSGVPIGEISDGYHTFDDLYEHRIELFMTLCCQIFFNGRSRVWASKLHSDGSSINGWFVLGIDKTAGQQITYHLPVRYWDRATRYAKVLDKAPEFDGHTSGDVLERLRRL